MHKKNIFTWQQQYYLFVIWRVDRKGRALIKPATIKRYKNKHPAKQSGLRSGHYGGHVKLQVPESAAHKLVKTVAVDRRR